MPALMPGTMRKGMPRRHQGQGLLPAAAEDEGIAALEAQHAPAFAGELDQPQRDVALLGRGLAAALAGVFQHDAGLGEIEDPVVDQGVIDDDLGLPQPMERQQRQQARVAGTGAGEPDGPRLEGRQIAEKLFHGAHSRRLAAPRLVKSRPGI